MLQSKTYLLGTVSEICEYFSGKLVDDIKDVTEDKVKLLGNIQLDDVYDQLVQISLTPLRCGHIFYIRKKVSKNDVESTTGLSTDYEVEGQLVKVYPMFDERTVSAINKIIQNSKKGINNNG